MHLFSAVRIRMPLAAGIALALNAAPLAAQNFYDWDGGANSTRWFDANNWDPNTAIINIINDPVAVLRFDGTPAATPASSGLPGNSNVQINGLVFSGIFNATQTAEVALGAAAPSHLTFRGSDAHFVVDNGQVRVTQLAGSQLRLDADTRFAIGGQLRIDGSINNTASGARSLAKTGAGALILRGVNGFGGSGSRLVLQEGVLDIADDGQLGHAATVLTFAGDGITPAWLRIDADGGQRTLTHPISTSGNGGYRFETIDTDAEGVAIVDALDAGGAPALPMLRKTGDGTLRLQGVNDLSRLVLEDGRLRARGAGALSTWPGAVVEFPAGSDAVLSLDGFSASIAGVTAASGSAAIVENGGSSDATLALNSAADQSFGGILRDGGSGRLALSFAGNAAGGFTLSGNNTFTGDVDVDARLRVAHVHALGDSATGITRIHDDGRLLLPFALSVLAYPEPLQLDGGAIEIETGVPPRIEGSVSVSADSRIEGVDSGLALTGAFDLGAHTLRIDGPFFVFEPSSAQYASGARVELFNAQLLAAPAALFDDDAAPLLHVGSGASLQIGGDDAIAALPNRIELAGVGSISGEHTLHVFGGSGAAMRRLTGNVTLLGNATIGGNSNLTLAIDGVIDGSGDLVKRSANRLVLSAVNTYSGDTYIEDGELQVNGALASPTLRIEGPGCCDATVVRGTPWGVLSGIGSVGEVELHGGAIAPGSDGSGVFSAQSLHVAASSTLRLQLGEDPDDPAASDRLLLGSLAHQPGARIGVVFGDGTGMPQPGAVYTLIETTTPHALTAADFALVGYGGALPDFGGRFLVTPQAVRFEVIPGYLFADGFD